MTDTLASAACDAAMGEAAQPSIMDRLAELEAQGRVLGAQQVTLADLIARSAASSGNVAEHVAALQQNVTNMSAVLDQAAGMVGQLVETVDGVTKRLAIVEKRAKVRAVPGRP